MTYRRLLPVLPLAVLLAGCGGSAGADSAPSGPAPSTADGTGRAGPPPGANGTIAEASAGTLQVQGQDTQTTVTYTAATTFSRAVPATAAVGDCVAVIGEPTESDDAITAQQVLVFAATADGCTARRPGSDGTPRTRPSGAPSDAPGDGQQRRQFATAVGKVTAAGTGTLTLSGILRTGGQLTASPTAAAISVTLGSARVLKSVPATSAAAVVGQCAAAQGKADSTGTVAATSIAVSPPGPNGCLRFGGFGR